MHRIYKRKVTVIPYSGDNNNVRLREDSKTLRISGRKEYKMDPLNPKESMSFASLGYRK